MKILPVSNNYQQQKFGARVHKSQLGMIKDAAQDTGIPQMYTVLEMLDKMGGKKATLKQFTSVILYDQVGFSKKNLQVCQVRIDGKLIKEGDTMAEALVNGVTTTKKDGKVIRTISKADFDKMCENNSNKTLEDIEKMLAD